MGVCINSLVTVLSVLLEMAEATLQKAILKPSYRQLFSCTTEPEVYVHAYVNTCMRTPYIELDERNASF